MSIIRDRKLAPLGQQKINWVKNYMPVLNYLKNELLGEKPLSGKKITMSIHLEAKTAYLALILRDLGAEVAVTGSNPLSTQDEIAAALVEEGLEVFAWHGATPSEYEEHLIKALEIKPDIIIDDGGDLVHILHHVRPDLALNVIGGAEETTTGVHRLRILEKKNALKFPMIAVNDALTKHMFDNRYGTGESSLTALMATTNLLIAGKNLVVAGYGWCGKGVAQKARGLGARVIVTEVNPIRALEAYMDGFEVTDSLTAAKIGDIFITVTGCKDVFRGRHFEVMKNGAILANAGHFNVEINLDELKAMAVEIREVRPKVTGYILPDGRQLNVIAEGRLVNLAAGQGHPAEIIDLSFSLQLLAVLYLLEKHDELLPKVYNLPNELDEKVALYKLKSLNIEIDKLTDDQKEYLFG
ncbi:adenosylhomocysteinase [Carboxydothermus hydrogenoformans]|uniref:Adenosylhomocysteinase n=1 Tax=Carboxydothermus hydrogenoformans (strain ATCC BAA-161 / DSM 6008 / Z-2901) TaxID=246194 RepID=Q3AC62_CARHZ|nr:adenosylhomocysteinase [Carboxydothermus hydrogenoformans]ABB14535.1 adenosylhomocysteinase [Carboxydothermus hydrogenoformans Z-2901]